MPNAPMPTAPSAEPMPTSSSASASRDGTSSPSGVLCESVREVVKPNAPHCSASMVRRRISAMSSRVATSRRTAEELVGIGAALGAVGTGAFGMNSDFEDEDYELDWMTRLARQTGRPIWFL